MKQIKLCLIGCGGHAKKVYADSISKYMREFGDVELLACCDTDIEKARAFSEKTGFARVYSDYDNMLNIEKPDAVILVTPFFYTAQIAVDVIERGFHVLLEKPPGNNVDDCLAIADAVTRKDPINMVAFNRRNMPMTKKLVEIIRGGEKPLNLQHIDYQMYRYRRNADYFHTTAIHGIDMVGHIAGSTYKRVGFQYADVERYGQYATNFFLQGLFGNGVTTQQSYCRLSGMMMERLTIAADDVTIYAETPLWHGPDFPGVIKIYRDMVLETQISGAELDGGQELFETDGFYNQLCEFINCVKTGQMTSNGIFSAIDSMKIANCLARRDAVYSAND